MVNTVKGKRSPKWAFMNKTDIMSNKNDGEVYLARLRILQTPWFGVMLHRINEEDYDNDPHDHPWNFASFIVRGGYTERVWPQPYSIEVFGNRAIKYDRRWNRWSWHRMTRHSAHRITSVQPGTISLIFTGARRLDWGFYTPDGWVSWKMYERGKLMIVIDTRHLTPEDVAWLNRNLHVALNGRDSRLNREPFEARLTALENGIALCKTRLKFIDTKLKNAGV